MKKKGKLIVISAPSGTGKTTIIKNVLNTFPGLSFSISATTRKKRRYEVDGKDYFFLSEIEFQKKINDNKFLEWENFYGYFYGTLKSFVLEKINNGTSIVLEIDVKGAVNIKENYQDTVLIFISPPSIDELKKRLKNRKTESDVDFEKRIKRAEMELTYKDKFDYNIYNYNLKDAELEINNIIKSEID